MAVGSTNFAFPMPSQGANPWTNEFYTLINAVDAKMLTTVPPVGKTIKWGLAAHYVQAQETGTALEYVGTHDRKDGAFKNLGIESVAAIPPAVGNQFAGRAVYNADKLWVCRDIAAGGKYTPLVRPILVVGPDTKEAEYTSIQTALSALPAAGGTVFVKAGTYALAAALVVPAKARLVGEGRGTSIDYSAVAEAYGCLVADVAGVTISDIQWVGGAGKNGIRLRGDNDQNLQECRIERCRFSNGVNAIEIKKDGGGVARQVRRIRISDCDFAGAGGVSASGIYSEAVIQDLWIGRCHFSGWGEVDAKHAIHIVGAANAWRLTVQDCHFEDNGAQAGAEEADVYVDDVDEVVVSGILSKSSGGPGISLKTLNRLSMSDCVVRSPAGAGFVLDGVVDGSVSGCHVSGSTDDGWQVLNSSKVRFAGCSADSAAGASRGFELGAANAYLVFEGCTSRGSGGDDLNLAAGTTNCRLGFRLSKAAGGAVDKSNGEARTHGVPIEGFAVVTGAGSFTEVGALGRAGLKMTNAAETAVAGSWIVPARAIPGGNIDFHVMFAGEVAPVGAADDVSFTVNAIQWVPGGTVVDDAGATADAANQAVTAAKKTERSAAMVLGIGGMTGGGKVAVRLHRLNIAEAVPYPNDIYVLALEAVVREWDVEVIA